MAAAPITLVGLTAGEADAAEWAIEPMACYWADQLDDGEIDAEPELPVLRGHTLRLPHDPAVWQDFLYRLEEQLPDMASQRRGFETAQRLSADVRIARSLARKIREAAGYTGPVL
jgi:hypothetical protein